MRVGEREIEYLITRLFLSIVWLIRIQKKAILNQLILRVIRSNRFHLINEFSETFKVRPNLHVGS